MVNTVRVDERTVGGQRAFENEADPSCFSLRVGTDCQLTSGAAHSTNILALKTDVKFDGPVKTYESAAASGNIITRSFCSVC
jgi:hypothetical protein